MINIGLKQEKLKNEYLNKIIKNKLSENDNKIDENTINKIIESTKNVVNQFSYDNVKDMIMVEKKENNNENNDNNNNNRIRSSKFWINKYTNTRKAYMEFVNCKHAAM